MLDLSVGFETRIKDTAISKHNHYNELWLELRMQYSTVLQKVFSLPPRVKFQVFKPSSRQCEL